ncbi:MAG: 50S ribosomal protein L32e [Ignisphaera sp.]|uniref:Large ribosomal subunit protein eL32 n=1 Tax=Ignisphaera aggregans TaxID=334771 RepID=A0A7J3MZG4_9CREN
MSAETSLKDILDKRKNILKQLRARRKSIKKAVSIRVDRPKFLRNIWWKFKKFENNLKWRKPRGKDNPMRLSLKGYPPVVKSGYGTPLSFRYLHPSGLEPVVISNSKVLLNLDPKKHIVYIASSVSLKKRLEIISVAKSRGFKIANA